MLRENDRGSLQELLWIVSGHIYVWRTKKTCKMPLRFLMEHFTNCVQMDGGRIIIDARMFYQQNPSSTPPFWPLEVPSENPQAYYEEGDSSEDDGEDSDSLDRSYLPPPPPPPPLPFPTFPVPPPPPIAYINDTLKIEENIPPLSEQDCRLCTPILRGFNLFSHAWGKYTPSRPLLRLKLHRKFLHRSGPRDRVLTRCFP